MESLTEAQERLTRVIDGRRISPWNWNTVAICDGRSLDGLNDLVLDAKVFGMLLVCGDKPGTGFLMTTEDVFYTATRRAYFAEFGIDLGISLHKSYVPWWAGTRGYDKYGRKAS